MQKKNSFKGYADIQQIIDDTFDRSEELIEEGKDIFKEIADLINWINEETDEDIKAIHIEDLNAFVEDFNKIMDEASCTCNNFEWLEYNDGEALKRFNPKMTVEGFYNNCTTYEYYWDAYCVLRKLVIDKIGEDKAEEIGLELFW